MRRVRLAAAVAVVVALVLVSGCQKKAEPRLEPKIKPPAIAEEGVLRVGVDFSAPPFAGREAGRQAGIDVDVAAAVSDRLGLHVEYVDVKPSDAATALADGKVDAVFSVPLGAADLSRMSAAGTYLADGPGLFMAVEGTSSVEASMSLDRMPAGKIAVQEGSESFWLLNTEIDPSAIVPFKTLREAFEAAESDEASAVAGDSIVASYISRDFAPMQFVGQLGAANPLAVMVAAENAALSEAVMTALDQLAADGVLDSIRSKWVGSLPSLEVAGDDEPTAGD